jgi:hypothetical protein
LTIRSSCVIVASQKTLFGHRLPEMQQQHDFFFGGGGSGVAFFLGDVFFFGGGPFFFFFFAPPRSRSLMYAMTTGAATTSSSLYLRPLVDKYSTASASAATPRRSSTCLAVRPCGTNSSGRRHFFPCTKNLTLMPRSGSNKGSTTAFIVGAAARYTYVGTQLAQKAKASTSATRRRIRNPYTKTEVKRLRNKVSKRDGTNTVRLPPE